MGCFYCVRPSSKDVRDYDEDMVRGSANSSGLVSDLYSGIYNSQLVAGIICVKVHSFMQCGYVLMNCF